MEWKTMVKASLCPGRPKVLKTDSLVSFILLCITVLQIKIEENTFSYLKKWFLKKPMQNLL